MKRILRISYSTDQKKKFQQFQIEAKKYQNEITQRNLQIIIHRNQKRSDLFMIELYGYDGLLKYQTNKISHLTFPKILSKIDKMPMGQIEKKSLNLYTNAHPEKTLKVGFKNASTAISTIHKVEKSKKSNHHKYLIIHTMYYRAKYHPHQTKEMKEAMKIFKEWLNEKKIRKKQKGGDLSYLPLSIILPFEKLADYYQISKKARGLEKPTTTNEGFLVVYKRMKDPKKLKDIPCKKSNPNGVHWDRKRNIEIKGKIGQMKRFHIPLYHKEGILKGLPTKMHVILVMWGYSPDPKGLKKSMKLLKKIPSK